MKLLHFYYLLTIVGILLDVLVIILANNQATTELLAVCFVAGILCLIIGVRGIANKFKKYM